MICVFQVGYTTEDLVYRWNAQRQVAIAEDMKLSQFDLIANPSANHTDRIPHPHAYAIRKFMVVVTAK